MIKQEIHAVMGMNKDLSVSNYDPKLVFDARNIRITTRNSDGEMLAVTNENSSERVIDSGKGEQLTASGQIFIGECPTNDGVVIFSQNSRKLDYIEYFKKIDSLHFERKVLFQGEANFKKEHPVECIYIKETDSLEKVYFTDGINQPRLINILNDWTIINSEELDFCRAATRDDKSEIEITRTDTGGSFAPGTITYAFSYFNKNAQETKLFKISPMYYVSYIDKGVKVTDKVSNSFKIRLEDLDPKYEFLRVYSINRSSANDVPLTKIVGDYEIETEWVNNKKIAKPIVIIDTNATGSTVSPTDMFFIGGKEFTAETMVQKDNTLFLGNIKKKNPTVDITWQNLKFTPIYVDYKNKPKFEEEWVNGEVQYKWIDEDHELPYNPEQGDLSENTYYTYKINNDRSARETKRFKYKEFYKIGIICELENGEFTDVYPIAIVRNTLSPKTFITNLNDEGFTLPKNPLGSDNNEVVETYLTGAFRGDLNNENNILYNSLLENKVARIYPVVCYPTEQYRSVICQGLISPTLYNVNHRDTGRAFSMSSPRFRFCNIGREQEINYISNGVSKSLTINKLDFKYPKMIHNRTLVPSISMKSEIQNQTLGSRGIWKGWNKLRTTNIENQNYVSKFGISNDHLYSQETMRLCPYLYTGNKDDNGYEIVMNGFTLSTFYTQLNGPAAKVLEQSPNDGETYFTFKAMDKDVFVDKFGDQFFMDGNNLSLNSPELEQNTLSDFFANNNTSGTLKLRIVGFSNLLNNEKLNTLETVLKLKEPLGSSSVHGAMARLENMSFLKSNYLTYTDKYHASKGIINHKFALKCITPLYAKFASWDWQQGSMTFSHIEDGDDTNVILQKINANFWYGKTFYDAFNDIEEDVRGVSLFNASNNDNSVAFTSEKKGMYMGSCHEAFTTISRMPKSIQKITQNYFSDYGFNIKQNNGRIIDEAIYPEFVFWEDSEHVEQTPFCAEATSDPNSLAFNMPKLYVDYVDGDTESQYDQEIKLTKEDSYLKRRGIYMPARSTSIQFKSTVMSFHSPSHAILSLDNNHVITSMYDDFYGKESTEYVPFWVDESMPSYESFNVLSNSSPNYLDAFGLCIGELYRDPEDLDLTKIDGIDMLWRSDTWMGGKAAEHLLEWVICGDSVDMRDLKGNPMVHLYYVEGDSYFERYDCLKTFPFNNETAGVVEVFSTLIETRMNLDNKTDLNRGIKTDAWLTSRNPENMSVLNIPGYNQDSNFFNYRSKNNTITQEEHFPNQITWSLEKHYGENVDTWTSIALTNTHDLSGEYGECIALRKFNNIIYAFQNRAVSVVGFNERVSIPTSDDTPIQIANGYKMSGIQYISSSIGTSNKWSIIEGGFGLYFVDDYNKDFKRIASQSNIESLATTNGMKSVLLKTINANEKWNSLSKKAIKSFYDSSNGDIYFGFGDRELLAYNENLGKFISFYDYEKTTALFNIHDNVYGLEGENNLWSLKTATESYGKLYGRFREYYFTMISKEDPTFDKIFNTIEWRDSFNKLDKSLSQLKTFDHIEVWNDNQNSGSVKLENRRGGNLRKLFNVWRCQIPRDSKNKRDRIRNVDTFIKLSKKSREEDQQFRHLIKTFTINYKI